MKNTTAVCISKDPEMWSLTSIPLYCHTEGWKPIPRDMSTERVAYLAVRRNKAVEKALALYPKTQHLLMVDSYFLKQGTEIVELLSQYEECQGILGASTWQLNKTRLRSGVHFFDTWTTPEATNLRLKDNSVHFGQDIKPELDQKDWMKVAAVGCCYVFPRSVWEGIGYGVPERYGCEHNFLCEGSGLPVWLSLSVKLWRDPIIYPWVKRVRMSTHLARFRPVLIEGVSSMIP